MISTANLRRFVVAGVLLMFCAHLIALAMSGQGAMDTPISQLSRSAGADVHTAGLLVLAVVQIAVAVVLARSNNGSGFWTVAGWLMVFNGASLLFIAFYFLNASDAQLVGADANDPLAVLASSVGVIMGLLQRDLGRRAPLCAWINGLLFVLWLALIPVIPFIDGSWLGAYERTVGAILLLWLAMLALLCPDSPHIQTS
ncbi:DUF998 domain-containing protein [Congregibacter brevis]|uniref:DUF998 domain-containing protein n=1 Tax=Congregibacter brevis TaxID=3081201 RepID=A0ABZ0IBY6_9GAMM|nr:DUF998 domain-containing protein [Congregibacter sp. IMCC45268]